MTMTMTTMTPTPTLKSFYIYQNLSYGTCAQLTKPSDQKKWARQNLSYGTVRAHKSQFLSSKKKAQQNLSVRHRCAPKINVGLNVGINFTDRKIERFFSYVKMNVGISGTDRGNSWNRQSSFFFVRKNQRGNLDGNVTVLDVSKSCF